MYPRTNYEMTEEDLEKLLDASKPTIVMKIGSYVGSSPQENANRAWAALGQKMGFKHETVCPIEGKSNCFFSAVPSETEYQKKERVAREVEEKKRAEIEVLKAEIEERKAKLVELSL